MGPTRKYRVTHNGYPTVMKLDDTDVKAYPDAELVDDEQAEKGSTPAKKRTPANKARTPESDK